MVKTSLVEAYDDRDVIRQISKLTDRVDASEAFVAEKALEVDGAVAESRAASSAAQGAVTSAEAAVSTANNASAEAMRAVAQVGDKVNKSGTNVPQVITGTGGLQIQGDLSVGGDLTVAASGHVHMDASDIEVANMAIEKSGQKTVLSNANGIAVNSPLDVQNTGVGDSSTRAVNSARLMAELTAYGEDVESAIQSDLDAYASMVRTTGDQRIAGTKDFIHETKHEGRLKLIRGSGADFTYMVFPSPSRSTVPSSDQNMQIMRWVAEDDSFVGNLTVVTTTSGERHIDIQVYDCNGARRSTRLI